jgi:drug/metabolite transporter (DMT)-like permease
LKTRFNLVDVALFFTAFIWALNFSVIKASLSEIDPFSYNALRFMLATALMWAVLARKKAWFTIRKEDRWPLLIVGLLGNFVYQWLFIVGINFTFSANAAVMLGTIPIWVAIFSHLLSSEKMTRMKGYGVILGFFGILAIILGGKNPISFGSQTFIGDLIIIASAICWGLYTVYSKRFLTNYTPLQFTVIMITIGCISLCMLAIPNLLVLEWSAISPAAYGGVVYSGLLAIGIAYIIWNYGLQTVGTVRTAAYQNLVPVLGLIFGVILLNEQLDLIQYIGSAIVITGIILARKG